MVRKDLGKDLGHDLGRRLIPCPRLLPRSLEIPGPKPGYRETGQGLCPGWFAEVFAEYRLDVM